MRAYDLKSGRKRLDFSSLGLWCLARRYFLCLVEVAVSWFRLSLRLVPMFLLPAFYVFSCR